MTDPRSTHFLTDADLAPTVTVALPVLDEERHLQAALASIAAQTYPFIMEVLVVDGGSSDQTREIARSYAGLPVRVLDNPKRIQAAALNVALWRRRESQPAVPPGFLVKLPIVGDALGALWMTLTGRRSDKQSNDEHEPDAS